MKNIIKIALVAALAIQFAGCRTEDEPDDRNAGQDVELNVRLEVAGESTIKQRGTVPGSDDEDRIDNFRVFLFKVADSQELAAYGQKDGTNLTDLTLLLKPSAGSYRLCVVVNYEGIGPEVRTYPDFKRRTVGEEHIPEAGVADGELSGDSPRCVMYGEKLIVLTRSSAAVNFTVEVDRLAAKIGFSLYNELDDPADSYEVQKVYLVNAPARSQLTPVASAADYVAGEVVDEVLLYSSSEGYAPTAAAPIAPRVAYLYENLSGTVDPSQTDQKQKGAKGKTLTDAGKKPAYLLIEGIYRKADNSSYYVSQVVYLGHDNHSDFDVKRNEYHDYTIIVRSEAETDTRVTVTVKPQLDFVTTSQKQDAHYVIYPIVLSAKNSGGWVLTSDKPWLKLRKNLTEWQQKGYWIDGEQGASSVSGIDGENITVYALLSENTGTAEREAVLSLKLQGSDEAVSTLKVPQLNPFAAGSFGIERLEEYYLGTQGYPWGFEWNRTVTYRGDGLFSSLIAWLISKIYASPSVSSGWSGFFEYDVKIDYSKISDVSGASSASDGATNTRNLFYSGAGKVSELETVLINWGMDKVKETGSWNNVEYYAAKMCLLKNKFRLVENKDKLGNKVYTPEISQAEVRWYLPASGQFPLTDSGYPLVAGAKYWSSTAAASSKSKAYKTGGGESSESRNSELRIRCIRSN